jgi:hypothetical protein
LCSEHSGDVFFCGALSDDFLCFDKEVLVSNDSTSTKDCKGVASGSGFLSLLGELSEGGFFHKLDDRIVLYPILLFVVCQLLSGL